MGQHVAELARPGQLRALAPREIPAAPVLEPLRAEVPRRAERAARDEVLQVAHRRHEAIGEGRHVAHAGGLGGLVHLARLGDVHRNRLLAEHVLAGPDGGDGDVAMHMIGRRDDHGVDAVLLR